MGQGVALRLGYELAVAHGAKYVVTLDADGQNDPAEIPGFLAPLLDGTADFVIGSRRLGTDETTDKVRMAGVVFFATVINALTGQHITDTSNGFRALKIEVLRDVTLEQDQYQTAELIISAAYAGVADRGLSRRCGTPGRRASRRRATTPSSACSTPGDRAHLAARSPLT